MVIITTIFYNYSEIITIQLTSYLNLKPVNWNFVNNRLTVQLSGFGSQPYTYYPSYYFGLLY